MATIKDIAQLTGVSATTVSNVIHGRGKRVSAETISRIDEAIKQLGYVPNMSARSLVNNSSRLVAVINHAVTNKSVNFLEDPFHSAFIGTVEEELRQNEYYLMVRTVADSADLLTFVRNWNVDGMFVTGIFHDSFFDTIATLSMPVVLIDSYIEHPSISNIGLEDFNGSYTAVEYLIKKGHRNIAFVSPNIQPGGVLHERYLGYQKALEKHQIPFHEQYIFETQMDMESFHTVTKEILQFPQITAIAATADAIAAGIMKCMQNCGIRIPEDISIIGFDDVNISRITNPSLTTIHQDMYLKGKCAVDTLLECLENKHVNKKEIILPTSLIERSSVKEV